MLLGVCDLETWQPTYTVVCLLYQLEVAGRARGEREFEIEFNPGSVEGFGRRARWPADTKMRLQCLNNIALPMCHMLPGVTSVKVLTERRELPEGAVGNPAGYDWPSYMDNYRAGIRPLRYHVDPALKNPKLITMTLRECGKEHWQTRNSNVPEWIAAARDLHLMGYTVRVVRDTRFARVPLKERDIVIAPHASEHLAHRAELYNMAALNLFVNNGPAWFAMAMDLPTILFRPVCNIAGKSHNAISSAAHGVIEGKQIEGAPSHQRLCWKGDDRASILEAVTEFMSAHHDTRSNESVGPREH